MRDISIECVETVVVIVTQCRQLHLALQPVADAIAAYSPSISLSSLFSVLSSLRIAE